MSVIRPANTTLDVALILLEMDRTQVPSALREVAQAHLERAIRSADGPTLTEAEDPVQMLRTLAEWFDSPQVPPFGIPEDFRGSPGLLLRGLANAVENKMRAGGGE